jgi:hypothetical protein
MSNAAAQMWPMNDHEEGANDPVVDNHASTTTPGGNKEGQWQTVAQTAGLLPAQIIGGRLEAEGIPTRVWQEGAGRALGLTVGMLGAGHVMVPEEYVEQALEILAEAEAMEDLEGWDEEE